MKNIEYKDDDCIKDDKDSAVEYNVMLLEEYASDSNVGLVETIHNYYNEFRNLFKKYITFN